MYENYSIQSWELIGTNDMMVETFNQIVLKEKKVFASFSKMIFRFMWNILSFLPQNGENFQLQAAVKYVFRGALKTNKTFCES